MSDIELPDFGVQSDLSIDIEKGIFLRKKNSNLTDNESNDSGNNSMNTNGSGTSCLVTQHIVIIRQHIVIIVKEHA